VNAHGTSTPPNDRVETLALKRVFGRSVPLVSSTKSMTGHTLGAAGALESVFSILALQNSVVPPRSTSKTPTPIVTSTMWPTGPAGGPALCHDKQPGLRGHNASLVFGQVAGEQDLMRPAQLH